jgi:lipid A disaccharide synthetase
VFGISLKHYSLPNLVAQEAVFPELFGPHLTEEALWNEAKNLWFDERARKTCKLGCEEVWKRLGMGAASSLAAERVIQSCG